MAATFQLSSEDEKAAGSSVPAGLPGLDSGGGVAALGLDSIKSLRTAEMEIWAKNIRDIPVLQQRRAELGPQARSLRYGFGCAGACVSAWALEACQNIIITCKCKTIEAMQIEHEDFELADCKEAAFTFCTQNHVKCKHFYRSLAEMISPTEVCWKCQQSGGNCFAFENPDRSFNLDVAECDAPCQPFSRLRDRGEGGTPEDHAGYAVTFGNKDSLLAWHERIQGHWVVGEQVMAILQKTTADNSVSYLDKIMEKLLAIKDPVSGKQKYVGHGSFFIEAKEQSEVTRGRRFDFCYISIKILDKRFPI